MTALPTHASSSALLDDDIEGESGLLPARQREPSREFEDPDLDRSRGAGGSFRSFRRAHFLKKPSDEISKCCKRRPSDCKKVRSFGPSNCPKSLGIARATSSNRAAPWPLSSIFSSWCPALKTQDNHFLIFLPRTVIISHLLATPLRAALAATTVAAPEPHILGILRQAHLSTCIIQPVSALPGC